MIRALTSTYISIFHTLIAKGGFVRAKTPDLCALQRLKSAIFRAKPDKPERLAVFWGKTKYR
jgi:hypothetical protein